MTSTIETELRSLTLDLQAALDEFRNDSRLAQMAEQDVPDARHRLQHVLKLTDDAAHRTLDLVEQSVPLAERTAAAVRGMQKASSASDAGQMAELLVTTGLDMDMLRANLTEMLLAQGYQDISGQILRSVMKLVDELEVTLARLLKLSGEGASPAAQNVRRSVESGPAVPGIAAGASLGKQADVDDLLTGLGL